MVSLTLFAKNVHFRLLLFGCFLLILILIGVEYLIDYRYSGREALQERLMFWIWRPFLSVKTLDFNSIRSFRIVRSITYYHEVSCPLVKLWTWPWEFSGLGVSPYDISFLPRRYNFLLSFFQAHRHYCASTLATNVSKDMRVLTRWKTAFSIVLSSADFG
jgi:hypothetical protein